MTIARKVTRHFYRPIHFLPLLYWYLAALLSLTLPGLIDRLAEEPGSASFTVSTSVGSFIFGFILLSVPLFPLFLLNLLIQVTAARVMDFKKWRMVVLLQLILTTTLLSILMVSVLKLGADWPLWVGILFFLNLSYGAITILAESRSSSDSREKDI